MFYLNNFSLVSFPRRLSFWNSLRLLKAILANPNLCFVSSLAPPLLLTVAPRYIKLSTSSRSFQFRVAVAFDVGLVRITYVLPGVDL